MKEVALEMAYLTAEEAEKIVDATVLTQTK